MQDRDQVVVRGADEAQLGRELVDDRHLDSDEHEAEHGEHRSGGSPPAAKRAAARKRREAKRAVPGEQAQRDHRHREIPRQHRQARDAGGQERHHARAEQRDRHVQRPPRAQPPRQHDPEHARRGHRGPRGVRQERDERARQGADAAAAVELVGEVARRVQREERVAGDSEVEGRPREQDDDEDSAHGGVGEEGDDLVTGFGCEGLRDG